MQAQLREQLQGSQVLAGVVQIMQAQHTDDGTAQEAGAGQPSTSRCCENFW